MRTFLTVALILIAVLAFGTLTVPSGPGADKERRAEQLTSARDAGDVRELVRLGHEVERAEDRRSQEVQTAAICFALAVVGLAVLEGPRRATRAGCDGVTPVAAA